MLLVSSLDTAIARCFSLVDDGAEEEDEGVVERECEGEDEDGEDGEEDVDGEGIMSRT